MKLHKVNLTIYGSDADKILVVLPDVLRILAANKIKCEVGKMMTAVDA